MLPLLLLLLSRFSRGRLCAAPQTAAHQAPRARDSPDTALPFPYLSGSTGSQAARVMEPAEEQQRTEEMAVGGSFHLSYHTQDNLKNTLQPQEGRLLPPTERKERVRQCPCQILLLLRTSHLTLLNPTFITSSITTTLSLRLQPQKSPTPDESILVHCRTLAQYALLSISFNP